MVTSGRHPKKEIADALRDAENADLAVQRSEAGHSWGTVVCGECGDTRGVWRTPRSQDTHAKQIRRFTSRHEH
jgi:hypothetical protein